MHHGGRGRGSSWWILLRPVVLHQAILTAMLIAGFPFEMSDIMLHGLGHFRHDPMARESKEGSSANNVRSFHQGEPDNNDSTAKKGSKGSTGDRITKQGRIWTSETHR